MKNIIKELWSCWDKIDRFVAIFSIIAIITLMCIFCTSCNAQPSTNNIPTMEYNDASGEVFDYDGAILIIPANVIDFIFHTQDFEFVIEYDDPDAFDPDYMIYDKETDTYYIEIYCDSLVFFDYLDYYNTLNNTMDEFWEASDRFFIEEDYIGDTMYYRLTEYGTKEDN